MLEGISHDFWSLASRALAKVLRASNDD